MFCLKTMILQCTECAHLHWFEVVGVGIVHDRNYLQSAQNYVKWLLLLTEKKLPMFFQQHTIWLHLDEICGETPHTLHSADTSKCMCCILISMVVIKNSIKLGSIFTPMQITHTILSPFSTSGHQDSSQPNILQYYTIASKFSPMNIKNIKICQNESWILKICRVN